LHPSDEAYGADRILLDSIEAARDEGRRVAVLLANDGPPGWLSSTLGERDIDFERVDLAPVRRRYLKPRAFPGLVVSMFRARRTIRARARALDAAIVHVNSSALLVAAVIGRPGGARLVWHLHEIITQPRLLAWVFRTLPVVTSDRVVVVSSSVESHLRPSWLARRRVRVVYNGIERRNRRPMELSGTGYPIVAFAGRLNRWKGYEIFVEAAGCVGKTNMEVRFVVAGSPPEGEEWREADLTHRIEKTGLGERIKALGYCADVPSLFDFVQVVVVPSLWPDPFPTVVLEAMRSGCAVIATDHGGPPEMIQNELSGLLVPPGDLEALAAAIERLAADESLRKKLGAAAEARVRDLFTPDRFSTGLQAVWRSCR
jgi:glycosyltransferase involved in cell wall biosynthesis